MLERPYHPALPLRNGHIQTFLASSCPNPMQAISRAEVLTTEAGVRLPGWRSRQTAASSKALVVLFEPGDFFRVALLLDPAVSKLNRVHLTSRKEVS